VYCFKAKKPKLHIMKSISFFLVLFFVMLFQRAYLQPGDLVVKAKLVGTAQGLKESETYQVAQDNFGFIWATTQNYLSRYEGYRFTDFTYLFKDSSNGFFTSIIKDAKGNIWVEKGKKIYILNPATMVVRDILIDTNHTASGTSLEPHPNFAVIGNFIWIFFQNHVIARLDENGRPDFIDPQVSSVPPGLDFGSGWVDSAGNYYLHFSPNRVDVLDKNLRLVHHIIIPVNEKVYKGRKYVLAFLRKHDDHSFTLTYQATDFPGAIEFIYWPFDAKPVMRFANELPYGMAKNILQLQQGTEWYVGVDHIGYQKNNILYNITPAIVEKTGEPITNRSSVTGIDGTLWVGGSNGILSVSVKQRPFETYMSAAATNNQQSPASVRSMVEDSAGNILISSYGTFNVNSNSGQSYTLHMLNKKTNTVHNLPGPGLNVDNNMVSSPIMNKMIKVGKHFFGVTDGNYFMKFSDNFSNWKVTNFPSHAIAFKTVINLNDSIFWIGTENGMFEYNIVTTKTVAFNDLNQANCIKATRVRQFLRAPGNKYWAATGNGVYLLNQKGIIELYLGKKPGAFIQAPFTEVLAICVAHNRLWLATTREGIFAIDTTSKMVTHYTENEGLADNRTVAIIPDDYGNIWVSTYGGISRLDTKTNQFANYTTADGLANNEFNYSAFLYSRDHKIYFGSVDGIVKIDPANITTAADTAFSNIQLVQFAKYSDKQKQRITYSGFDVSNNIDIAPDESFLEFTFMTANYRSPDNKIFRYRLAGLKDEEWQTVKMGNQVVFSSLPPGDHILEVQVSNDGKKWAAKSWVVNIHVHPHWYNSGWMYILAALVSILVTAVVYRVRLRRYQHIANIKRGISADLHDEVGSTLSSISLYSQALLTQPNGQGNTAVLERIRTNAQLIQGDLQDIVWSMKLFDDKFSETVRHMYRFGNEILEAANIDFEMTVDDAVKNRKMAIDRQKELYLIFKEAVNNAAKHAACTMLSARLFLSGGGRNLHLVIADNGKGFDTSKGFHGNGLGNMEKRAKKLRAVFAVSSEKGKGTTISLTMKS